MAVTDERTLVLVKPDGVARNLTGKIISQLEDAGLRLVHLRMVTASAKTVEQHYPTDPEWFRIVGGKTLEEYTRAELDVVEDMGTSDAEEIGRQIKRWLIDYLTSGPVVAMVLEGNEAIANVRRLCGHTIPIMAEPSTIRGRFATDSAARANGEKRPVQNLVHASGNVAEAAHEIALWFG